MSSFRRFVLHHQQDVASKPTTTTTATSVIEVPSRVQANTAPSPAPKHSSRPALAQKDLNKLGQTSSVNTKVLAEVLTRVRQVQQVQKGRPARQSSGFITRNVLAPKFAGVTKAVQQPKPSPLSAWKRSNAAGKAAKPVEAHAYPTLAKPKQTTPTCRRKNIGTPAKQTMSKKKKVATTGHPLYTAFREATTAYTSKITAQLPALLNTAIENLSTALDAVSLKNQKLNSASANADLPLTTPFDEEKLNVSDPVTKEKVRTTVGARMTAFDKVFQTEWKRIGDSWRRHGDVVQQIRAMSVDTTTKASVMNVNTDIKNYAVQHRQLQEEYQRRRDEILQRFQEANQGLVAKVEAGEKKYEASRKKQRQSFLQFMQAQMLEDEE